MNKKYILSVFSQNRPGVLSRIAGLLRRKLFQIDSLTVGRTEKPDISRFTIVIEGGVDTAEKVSRMLENLVEVLSVEVLPKNSTTREIVLARFQINQEKDIQIIHDAEEGVLTKEISRKRDELVIELIDTSDRLEAFLRRLKKSKIIILEWVRSGVIAIRH